MPQLVVRGNTVTLDALYRDSAGDAVDPDPGSALVSIIDAEGTTVVELGTPTKLTVGHYAYGYPVSVNAPTGAWAARWYGTLSGVVLDPVDDFFTVTVDTGSAPPSADRLYVSLAEFHAWAHNLPDADEVDDAEITVVLGAVSRGIDDYCGFPLRRFYLDDTTSVRLFEAVDDDLCRVTDFATTTGLKVEIDIGGDGEWLTLDPTEYQCDPVNALADHRAFERLRATGRGNSFPVWAGMALVRVTAQWGWPAVPDVVRSAARIQAQRIWKRRDAAFGVIESPDFPGIPLRARLDPDVEQMLTNVRRVSAAGVSI